jgi:hypothetical protein
MKRPVSAVKRKSKIADFPSFSTAVANIPDGRRTKMLHLQDAHRPAPAIPG